MKRYCREKGEEQIEGIGRRKKRKRVGEYGMEVEG